MTTLHHHYVDSLDMMSFRSSVDPGITALLDEIAAGPDYVGASNAGIMSILYTLILTCRLRSVLQLGTYVGFSTLILGDAVRKAGGQLITLDPDEDVLGTARGYISRAGLDEFVTTVQQGSTDPEAVRLLRRRAPFDLIYIDTLHNYDHARQELPLYWPMLRPSGFLCLDDASKAAVKYDTSRRGGVYRAVREWLGDVNDCEWILTREPVWPHAFGAFLATKVPAGEGFGRAPSLGIDGFRRFARTTLPYRTTRKIARFLGVIKR